RGRARAADARGCARRGRHRAERPIAAWRAPRAAARVQPAKSCPVRLQGRDRRSDAVSVASPMPHHRIAIGGMAIESSTFSPHRSTVADFTIRHGDDLLTRYEPLAPDVDWLPLVHARALPGGPVDPDFYLAFKAELLERPRAARTRERAIANLVRCLRERIAPRRAWVRVPVLLAGERACTRDEPARGIYGRLAEVERRDGIIDAAVWIGYAWADEPRCGAAVV